MSAPKFRIAVTGDTGYDYYTQYVEGFVSSDHRVRKPVGVHDLYVPSGAAFLAHALLALWPPAEAPNMSIEHLSPKNAPSSLTAGGVRSTLQKFLVELDFFKTSRTIEQSHVLRVKQARPIRDKDQEDTQEVFNELQGFNGGTEGKLLDYDLLIIHDGAGSWRRYPSTADGAGGPYSALKLVRHVLQRRRKPNRAWPRIIVNLNHDLPDVSWESTKGLDFAADLTFWTELAKPENSDQVCVVCSVNMLRREGAAISRRLSWEQTVEDIAADLLLYNKLAALSRFRHLIIRLGMVGAVHIETTGAKRKANLIYAPLAKTGVYRDPIEDGRLHGQNDFLIAALVQAITTIEKTPNPPPTFTTAIKTGLLACMRAFDRGYWVPWNEGKRITSESGEELISNLFWERGAHSPAEAIKEGYDALSKKKNVIYSDQIIGDAPIPQAVFENPPGSWSNRQPNWELLRGAINPSPEVLAARGRTEPLARINIGMAIVLFGQDKVLNREIHRTADSELCRILLRPSLVMSPEEVADHVTLIPGKHPQLPSLSLAPARVTDTDPSPIYAPVMTFGNLVVVEREEIEGMRSIRNLFKAYVEESAGAHGTLPPLSVAVFGPPGSGKSFAVREIAKDINSALHDQSRGVEVVEYNVAQFRSVEELGDAITRASIINNEGKTPLVFFDEFDCHYQGGPLGWLKYFLAPMQDGMFFGARQTIKIARAIFVFAGGIYHKFDAFDPSSAPSALRGRKQESEEAEKWQKLFVEQKGPDFISRLRGHINIFPVNAEHGMLKPIIRRSIILRGLMEKRKLVGKVAGNKIGYIDEDVLYALLTLDRYRHGARSMDAILHMCTPIDDKIEKASLPSRAQLNMHIDADEFYIRMYRGRARPIVADRTPPEPLEPSDDASGAPPSALDTVRPPSSGAPTAEQPPAKSEQETQ